MSNVPQSLTFLVEAFQIVGLRTNACEVISAVVFRVQLWSDSKFNRYRKHLLHSECAAAILINYQC